MAYEALRASVRLPTRWEVVDADPYTSGPLMAGQVRSVGTLYIWSGGSDGLPWDRHANWAMRAVHDSDHLAAGAEFGFAGELRAWRVVADRQPQLAGVLFGEIVGQAAVAIVTGRFPEQKMVGQWPMAWLR